MAMLLTVLHYLENIILDNPPNVTEPKAACADWQKLPHSTMAIRLSFDAD